MRPCVLPIPLFALALCLAASAGAGPRERPWIEQVERDRDRGAGRIVDEPTWELGRLQERRDVRAGRLAPRRPFERFDEERDRELQLEARARRTPRLGDAGGRADDGSVVLRQRTTRGGTGPSPLATVVAREQRELSEAKETLDRSMRGVDAAEGRALRALRRRLNREGRPQDYDAQRRAVEQHHEGLREAHRRAYERVRARVVGRAPEGR